MIEGVRLLPFLFAASRLNPKAPRPYDCKICMDSYPEKQRRSFRCGWIADRDWVPVEKLVRRPVGGGHPNPGTCPGYTTQLPQVHEAARAWGWWDKGHSLGEFYECDAKDVPQHIRDLVELYHQSRASSEAWFYEEKDRRSGN